MAPVNTQIGLVRSYEISESHCIALSISTACVLALFGGFSEIPLVSQ